MLNFSNATALLKKTAFYSMNGAFSLTRRNLGLRFAPVFLWLEATDRCNAQCIHCNIWRATSSPVVLSPEEIESALRDPLFGGLKVVVVSGGEPTTRPDLKEVVSCIHRATPDAVIVINSNAILADRLIETAESYLNSGGVLHVGVSVDGIAECHDRIRGVEGLFSNIERVLRELVTLKKTHGERLGISVGFVLSDLTVDAMIPVKQFADSMGVEFNLQWYNEASYYGNIGERRLTFHREIKEVLRNFPPTIVNEQGMAMLKKNSLRFSCFSMFGFCVLKCNGDLVPCFRMWTNKVGNVKEKTATEIWECGQANAARKEVKRCTGCLFTCALQWSFQASFFPRLFFLLRHPGLLLEKIAGI
jgi:MoaA/NifB/PqqE/SkfB family radical SAM enzyme